MRSLLPSLAALVLLAGCSDDSPVAPIVDPPAGIQTDHTDPAAVLAAFDAALEARDLTAYAALLEPDPAGRAEPGFRYLPQSEDLIDFPWLQGEPWDRDVELGIIGHMFDPEFVSQQTGETLDTVNAETSILSQTDLGDDEIEVTTDFLVTVLWATNTGATSEVRLIHVLAPDADGFLRIREQRELPLLGPRVEGDSWAQIKALYR